MTDPALTALTLLALALLALAVIVTLARSRRYGARCTECAWHARTYTRAAGEERARAHAQAHRHPCHLYVRESSAAPRPANSGRTQRMIR